ncbi:Lrp/AsnC family transcriptional regulator [Candidatus Woesearchaeota archaeon]|nr:Lrp/AsnC family transcriptional regulator [Candidatus Woesearchaeota archaeon]MBT6518403.1 Lrp/AsnC family transcriptional regulator [Candidatus Woesearchaeota archaeon]MBT7366585.1 Lrp/AsnC family transcriptional regulator [Candidatus Woesearchaeota archaeon]
MDIKDKKLIYELELDARASFAKIGKKIGLSKETVINRVKRLENQGIIGGYNAIVNIAKLGFTGYAVFVRFENTTEKIKKELIEYIKKNNRVYWVALLGGNYDLLFAIHAKTILEFNSVYTKIQNKYGRYLRDNVISIRSQVSQFHRGYLVGKKEVGKAPYFGKEISIEELDDTDKKIINTISGSGRINVVDLSQKIKVARTTVHNRIKNLEKRGIMQSYSALIHPENYDYQLYQLMIIVRSVNEKLKSKMYAFALYNPNINFYVDCVGKWNFELSCEVKSQKELQELMLSLRSSFPEIVGIELVITFDYYLKYRWYV